MNSSATNEPLPFALVGAGFWSQFHAAAWQELPLARCVAIVDRDVARAEALAQRIPTAAVFSDSKTILSVVKPYFVDIVTTVESHAELANMAAQHKTHVICQKPLGESLSQASGMVQACHDAGV